MKISELKQPYRRMADYLRKNVNKDEDIEELGLCFYWHQTDVKFWLDVNYGKHPEITHEIKTHFPPNFDFSGEVEDERRYNFAFKNNTEEKYTQLAKEGKFDELPDTCEFSEPVELLVWDIVEPVKMNDIDLRLVFGKFRGAFIAQNSYVSNKYDIWQYAQLPTQKIDFSQFKTGDVVEVELSNEEKRIGWFDYADRGQVVIKTLQRKGNQTCNGGSCSGSKMFNLEKIKSITKIK